MGWADSAIAALARGETVQMRPRGHSMEPKIRSGALCTIAPVTPEEVSAGDVVLCKVRGNQYLHYVKAVRRLGTAQDAAQWEFQIGNARGGINGWTSHRHIYGRLVRIDP